MLVCNQRATANVVVNSIWNTFSKDVRRAVTRVLQFVQYQSLPRILIDITNTSAMEKSIELWTSESSICVSNIFILGSEDASFMSSSVFPIIIWFSITHSPRMSLCLSLAFGRNATGAGGEGVAAAVLSPVCVVCDPVDEVRRHSAEYGWTFSILTQVPLEHSYDGVATIPSFLDNHRRALVEISGEQLVWDTDMIAFTR